MTTLAAGGGFGWFPESNVLVSVEKALVELRFFVDEYLLQFLSVKQLANRVLIFWFLATSSMVLTLCEFQSMKIFTKHGNI